MTEVKDWRGTLIEVGDIILYAVKHSTTVEVNEAIVSEVGYKAPAWLAEFRNIKDEDKHPYVIAEWQTSSSYYRPGRKLSFSGDRTLKKVTLTNFAGLTVVAKHTPPAFDREPGMTAWANANV